MERPVIEMERRRLQNPAGVAVQTRMTPGRRQAFKAVTIKSPLGQAEAAIAGAGMKASCRSAIPDYCRQYNYFMEPTMDEAVSAADANRKFSLILRGVREGHSYVVTSHGRPVARIIPADGRETVAAGARAALLSRLERQSTVNAGRWTRDELYEDER